MYYDVKTGKYSSSAVGNDGSGDSSSQNNKDGKITLNIGGQFDEYRAIIDIPNMTLTLVLYSEMYELRRRPDTFTRVVDWCYLEESSNG